MSSTDAAAAKRAAAAEARRQKILARGTERLNRITVGTTIAAEAPETIASDSIASETPGVPPTAASEAVDTLPVAAVERPAGDASTESSAQREAPAAGGSAAPGATPSAADAMLQHLVQQMQAPDGSGRTVEQSDAAIAAAQRDAEQALHMLLNQLAGPAATGQFLMQRQQPNLGGGAGGSSHGRTIGQALPSGPAYIERNSRHGGGEGGGAGDGGRGRGGNGMVRRGGGSAARAIGALLLPFTAAIAALAGLLLGPQLTAAVEATRRLRCATALALAVLLYHGVVEVGHLRLPPVVALLLTQVAMIGAARKAGVSLPARTRLKKSASGQDLAGGGDDADDDAAAAGPAAAQQPPPRFDWLTLVPGLRPLMDGVSSAGALVSGLFGDVAVFLVTYLVLDAWNQVAGRAGGL